MEESRQTIAAEEEATIVVAGEEQTLVAPRFDDDETLVARPVVPLEAVVEVAPAAPAVAYAPARPAARRPWPLALMLASVLVGGVLGGAGLYFYQRQSGDRPAAVAPSAAASQPPQVSAGASQPAPAPPPEAAPPTPEAQPESPAAEAPAGEETPAPDSAGASADPGSVPASAPKRGKKGEHDEEIERSRRRANRAEPGDALSRANADGRGARRVDSILYRPRRAAASNRAPRETSGDVGRLRRIFEGTPE